MAHEWDSYFETVSPLSSDPKTLTTPEPEGSLVQHLDTFVGQHEFSNSTASHAAPATDSTFDTNYYSTSTIGNSTSDCAYQTFYRETPWQPDEELVLKNTSLKGEDTDVKDLAMNGLSTSRHLPASYSEDLQGLKQNCELLASSLLEDYSDVSSCSNPDVNETMSCKFVTSPTQQPKTESTAKRSPSEWLFTPSKNVTFPNEMKSICPDSPKLMDEDSTAECLQETHKSLVKPGSFNSTHNHSFAVIPTSENRTIEDCSDKEGILSQAQKRNVDHDLIEGYYSDISLSDSENVTSMENYPDHMKEHWTITPECIKTSIAEMKDNEPEKGTEEIKELCPLESEVNDTPNAIGQQETNTFGEEACSTVCQTQEKESDSLDEETLNAPTQTNDAYSACVDDESMITDNPRSDTENNCQDNPLSNTKIACQDNETNSDSPHVLNSPDSDSVKSICELLECINMPETDHHVIGALSENQPSQNEVLDNICSPVPMSDGHLNDAKSKLSLSDSSLIPNTPRTDTDLVCDDFGDCKNNPVVDIIPDLPQQPCSSVDTNIYDKKESICHQEKNQTSCKDSDSSGVAVHAAILDVHAENKNSISNDIKSSSQKSHFSNECYSNKDEDSGENTAGPNKSLSVSTEQEHVRASVEGMHTCEEEMLMPAEVYGEPSVTKHSSDTESMKLAVTCIGQLNGNTMDETEERDKSLISSLTMRKRLQPVVIINKMQPALSNLYQCAVCQQTTHSADQLIEHHHCQHSDPLFQFCKSSNQYLMSIEQSNKHVDNKAEKPHLGSDLSHQKRKPHQCNICNQKFSKLLQYVKHMRGHTGETPYKCDGCGSFFAQSCSLSRHKNKPGTCRNFKPGNPPQKSMKDRTLLENMPQCYVNLFDICKTNICLYCGKQYSSPVKVKKHVYKVHKGSPQGVWQNDTTMKICRRKKIWNVHSEKNENVENERKRKHKCPLCPRVFMHSYNRARHLRDCVRLALRGNRGKVGDRYSCPLCHATFTQSPNRYRHINTSCFKKTLNRLRESVESEQKVELDIRKDLNTKEEQKAAMENRQTESNLTTSKTEQSYECKNPQDTGPSKHEMKQESEITGKMIKCKPSVLSCKSKIAGSRKIKTEEIENIEKSDEKSSVSLSCRYCEKNCDTEELLKKHERCHRGERPYRCLKCGRGFKKRVYLLSHKVVHQSVQCALCRKIVPNARNLVQHAKLHHKGKKFPCTYCQQQFLNPTELLRHLKSHQREGKATSLSGETLKSQNVKTEPCDSDMPQCSLCKEVFDDALLLRKHCLTHISSCQCPFCNQKFKARRYLLSHMYKHTGEKPYSCPHCAKCFYHKPSMETHKERCLPTQQQERSEPKIQTHMESGLPTQQKNATSKLHACSICPRTFKKKRHWLGHSNGHKSNTLRVCTDCGMYFSHNKFGPHKRSCGETSQPNKVLSSNSDASQNVSQKSQTITETPSKPSVSRRLPFKCSSCGKSFRFQSLLNKHSVSHTGVQMYSCIHCDERFTSKALQVLHEEQCNISKKEETKNSSEACLETNNMPAPKEETQITLDKTENEHKCKFCTKTFVKPQSLRRHILTHNEVNPYRCKTCGSCFSRYDYLKVHHAHCKGKQLQLRICIPKISLDSVGKGWQNKFDREQQEGLDCKICSKNFPTQSGLSRHVTLFHTIKKFRCPRCDSTFTHEKSLTYHKKHKKCNKVLRKPYSTPREANPSSENNSKSVSEEKPTHNLKLANPMHKYACSYCPRHFTNKWRLQIHVRVHTGEKPFACDCGLRFIRNDYLKRHRQKCTVKLCKICGVAFPQKELTDHHMTCTSTSSQSTTHEETFQSHTKGFSCAYCPLRFSLFSQLQEHFLNAHKLETADSPISTAPLQQHLSKVPTVKDNRHDKQPSEGTNLTCKLDTALVGHVAESLVCPVCNISFENKAGLMGHSRVHAKETPYKCKKCKKGFWNKNLLRNHNRKCRFGNITARDTAQKLESSLKADLNLTLPDSVLMFKDESQIDSGVLQRKVSRKDDLKESSQKPSEDIAQSSDNKNKVVQYQCSECDLSFTDGLMLISHLEEHGREEQANKHIACKKCNRVFPSEAYLEKHMRSHGLSKTFSCSLCFKSFYTSSDLEVHKSYHDSNRPFSCKLCGFRFWSKQSLSSHYTEDHPDHSFACRFCIKSYATKKSLQRHYREWHLTEQKNPGSVPDHQPVVASRSGEEESSNCEDSDSDSAPYFPCHVCGKTFPTSENLEDHQKCHLGEKPHECAVCGKCFVQAAQLEQHKRMHKSELQCQVCGRGFVSLFALRKHKHSHGKSRPHRCARCQLSFSGASQLAEHMFTHREENFPCDICNRVFPSKSGRAEHRKEHTSSGEHLSPLPEKSSSPSESHAENLRKLKYRCGLCNERFKDPEDLSAHGCKVSKERPYSCSDCDKHFLHSSHLKQHRVIHQKSKTDGEYPCKRCNTTYSSLEHFLSHLKTHENDLTATGNNVDGYTCPICSRCFVKATELISHVPVHSTNKVKCKMCKITFSSQNQLEEHEKRYHTSVTGFECKGCGKSFLGSDSFHQHSCSHKQQELIVTANKSVAPINRQDAGEEEEIDVIGEELYNCSTCSMRFSSKSSLLEHQNKVHLIEKQFKCKSCTRSFSSSHSLRKHELGAHINHSPPAPQSKLKCPQCSSKFDTAQDLSSHMRLHAEKELGQHRCDMCYKSFSQASQLLRHQESHVGQIVYECTECDKAFAFPHLLEDHQKTHA